MSYDISDRVAIEATFQDDNGNPTTPDTINLGIIYPDGTTETHTMGGAGSMENPSTGTYRVVITTTMSGQHRYRWVATGPGAGAEEDQFWVNLSDRATVVP